MTSDYNLLSCGKMPDHGYSTLLTIRFLRYLWIIICYSVEFISFRVNCITKTKIYLKIQLMKQSIIYNTPKNKLALFLLFSS